MDADHNSLELLSHFDRPKRLSPADIVQPSYSQPPALPGVCETPGLVAHTEPPAEPGADSSFVSDNSKPTASRDARWVLKWAAASAVVAIAVSQLVAFGYVCAADRALNVAARAGASESILPRATYESICAAVERRLTEYPQLGGQLQITVLQNGRPVGQRFQAREEDRISITISAPDSAFMPGWLKKSPAWKGGILLTARPSALCQVADCGRSILRRRPNRVPRNQAPKSRSVRGTFADRRRLAADNDCG